MRRDCVDPRYSYGMHRSGRHLDSDARGIRPQNAKRKGHRYTEGCNVCSSRLVKIPPAQQTQNEKCCADPKE
jgi:hypothetical protein